MSYHVPESLHADRRQPAVVFAGGLDWTPSPLAGVDRRFLEREGAEIARATSLVRYAPGSSFSEHVHEMGEEFLVLEGVFSDATGDFPEGSYVRNPPGSRHAPFTREGCVIFVKLRQMRSAEARTVVLPAGVPPHVIERPAPGVSRRRLFEGADGEAVVIEQWDAGTRWEERKVDGGEEILVLEGELRYGDLACPPLTWLRTPPGPVPSMATGAGCRIWVKRGHLRS